MDSGGDQLLARSAFSNHQHGPIQLRHLRHMLQYLEKHRGFPDQWLFLLPFHQPCILV